MSSAAVAVPGPDSTLVLVNTVDSASVALADAYMDARDLPRLHRCEVSVSNAEPLPLTSFQSQIVVPLRACMAAAADRIEAVVVTRGFPLNVGVDTPAGTRNVSLTAAIAIGDSELLSGSSVLGTAPGYEGL